MHYTAAAPAALLVLLAATAAGGGRGGGGGGGRLPDVARGSRRVARGSCRDPFSLSQQTCVSA